MVMMVRVPAALRGAARTGGFAGPQLRGNHGDIGVGLTREHPGRRRADVGAIEIDADAIRELLDLRFAQTSIRAGGAMLGTLRDLIDGFAITPPVDVDGSRVGFEHLANSTHR